MARKTKEEALETRNQLLDAAEDVFYRLGYARTTLDAVAEAAGMTRGAIYWHFKNKSDLFNAMCDRVHLPMEQLAESVNQEKTGDPLHHMRNVAVFFLKECEQNAHFRKIIEILWKKTEFVDPADVMYIRQHEAALNGREHIRKSLVRAVETQHLSADTDIRLAGVLLQASIEGILQNWLLAPDYFSLAEEAERLVDACFDAIRHSPRLRKSPQNS
ncbi:TetR family transcriptional regulator [Noviherbaspirillum denitrificans]|uniref:TetR family transcriptional regulator n=1 Tax=Noviherbaspirillum denitrificans TaxID=1968433 RepID=A0A254THG6_9BURK|nr:TetR family transcriptional regulator [Noviherbaspirillum denitrificans]OWW20752.1 TetR family transcriptional regulator [Noviherbaspirillum denitrificans]